MNTKAKKVTIPATINYQGQSFKVTEIANKAFANNKKLIKKAGAPKSAKYKK